MFIRESVVYLQVFIKTEWKVVDSVVFVVVMFMSVWWVVDFTQESMFL